MSYFKPGLFTRKPGVYAGNPQSLIPARSMFRRGDYLYVGGNCYYFNRIKDNYLLWGGAEIYDVSTPSNPRFVSAIADTGYVNYMCSEWDSCSSYVSAMGETDNYVFVSYDGSVPIAPALRAYRDNAKCNSSVISPLFSTVGITGSGNLTCPSGDGGVLEMQVAVRDGCGGPVNGIPPGDIYAVTTDPGATPISCLGDTAYATGPTDPSGRTALRIPRMGGCGDVSFDVYADGVQIGRDTVSVRNPDLNGDCTVDSEDESLFIDYFMYNNPCGDLDGGGLGQSDIDIFYEHYFADGSEYHFSIHPGYSSANLTPSDPECLVLCPQGDLGSFSTLVIARNARNLGFPYSSIPADSIWAAIEEPPPSEPPGNRDFRFVCRPDPLVATADGPTWGPEKTTITVNSGGGHLGRLIEDPSMYWGVQTYIGGQAVDVPWTGRPKSPDIDASGQVMDGDMIVFCADYATYYWSYGPAEFRSDFDCDDDVDDHDFDVMNQHYMHACGASSQMMAEGDADGPTWSQEAGDTIRAAIPNVVLDRWLGKKLHWQLRALLEYTRSLDEPESPASLGAEVEEAAMMLLPERTALAQSYPNPFGGAAVIKYQVAPPGGYVTIRIYDAAGRLLRVLVEDEKPPGFYDVPWDGRNQEGKRLPSGVYFYQMKAPGFQSNKRMMLVR